MVSMLAHGGGMIGEGSNNFAEYWGAIAAFKTMFDLGIDHAEVRSDSKLIVNQVNGGWKCKDDEMAHHRKIVVGLMKQFKTAKITWVPREQNQVADGLASMAFREQWKQIDL